MSIASMEFYDVTDPNANDGDPFADVYAEHIPRVGEYVSLLLKKGEGYKKYIVREVEYLHDTTIRTYRDNHMTSVAIAVAPVAKP